MVLKRMKEIATTLASLLAILAVTACTNPLVAAAVAARNTANWSIVTASSATAKVSNHAVTLSWPDTPGATGYNLYWSTSPDQTIATATKIEGVASPYVHSGLTNQSNYYYFLTAVIPESESMPSAATNAMPMQIIAYINSVAGMKIYPVDNATGAFGACLDGPLTGYNLAFTVDPACKYAYLTDHSSTPDKIWSFSINSDTGALTAVGSSAACGRQAGFIVVNADSSFVYVGNDYHTESSISGFKVNADGSLSALSGFPVSIGDQINGLSVSPDRRCLYASTMYNKLYGYVIDTGTGGLTAISGSPITTPYTPGPVVFDSTSSFLYLANHSDNVDHLDMNSYPVNPTSGVLGTPIPNRVNTSSSERNIRNNYLAIDPLGRFLFVGNRLNENSITVFKITEGLLSVVKAGLVDSSILAYEPGYMTVDSLGNCLYVANGNKVESYSIDQTTGALAWLETTDNGSYIWDMTVVSLP